MAFKIGLDLMGSDNSPLVIVKGLINFLKEKPEFINNIVLYLTKEIESNANNMMKNLQIEKKFGDSFINVNDNPLEFLKKKNSTLVLALQDVAKGKIDSLISTCNTKVYIAASIVFLPKMHPKAKVVLASTLPLKQGGEFFFLDAGARINYTCKDFLVLAIYGIEGAKVFLNKTNPTIKLVNIGSEANKGDTLHIEANKLLMEKYPNNFKGNIDPYLFMDHDVDVLLTDGFSGNIMAKAFEGGVSLVTSCIKNIAKKNFKNKLALLVLKNDIQKEILRFDYRSKGAAFILGLNRILFKAHGRSDEFAIKNALKTSFKILNTNLLMNIKTNLEDVHNE